MSDLTQVRGIWVPARDAARFQKVDELEGLPNMDVKKVRAASAVANATGTALDVGAHVGITALLMARRFDRVVAFEPVPETYEALRRNTAEVDNIDHMHCGISEANGALRFEYQPNHGQLSHALMEHEPRQWEDSEITDLIPVRTIDSMGLDDVTFIKIDTEGFEGPVVFGARETIMRCRPVVLMEQRGNEMLFHGRPVNEASYFLESLGMVTVPNMPFWKDRVYRFPD